MASRQLNKLSAVQVRNAKEPGRYSDGGRLYLVIGKDGSRKWVFLYMLGGRQREMGLGAVSDVPLAAARDKAAAHRLTIAAGLDPLEAKRAERAIPTFGELADKVVEIATATSKNEKHQFQWKHSLEVKAEALRDKRVDRITVDDVLKVLEPLWEVQNETASRLRGRIERVLDYAKARGLRSGDNPAAWNGNLDSLLSARRKLTRGHHAAMPFADIPAFIASLRERPAVSAKALEFIVLTASRSGEAIGATWGEVDLKAKIWTVPGERMKTGKEHRVPLSERAVAILKEMALLAPKATEADLVFPGPKAGKPLSNMAISSLLDRMKVETTTHGFRSSFRDWAGEMTSFPREIAEAALAHQIGDEVERAYRRGDALEKRRKLMDAWAAFIGSPKKSGEVVGIGAGRREVINS